jgi:MFS family permease
MGREQHALAWGIIGIFRSIGMLTSPFIASSLLHTNTQFPLFIVLVFLVFSALALFCFNKFFPSHHHPHHVLPVINDELEARKMLHPFFQEITVWKVLLKKVWPLYLFIFTFFIIESTFLTVGVLFSEEMMAKSFWGNFIIPAYLLPALFTGMIIDKTTHRFGKKKTAFFAGLCAGILLFISSLTTLPEFFVLTVFCSSLFSSIALPALLSAFQDYMGRLHSHQADIIGIQNSAGSLAYIIGPIFAGGIALFLGNKQTFGVIGILLIIVSIINLIFVPKKIHIPQHELEVACAE